MMKTKQKTTGFTDEENAAYMQVCYATNGEGSGGGLDYIGCRLSDAMRNAETAAERILPEVADVKLNPAPALQSLLATPPEWKTPFALPQLGELIFKQLQKEISIKPDIELLNNNGWLCFDNRLATFAQDWVMFLSGYDGNGGCLALMRKKVALAKALGKSGAAEKLEEAFKQIAPSFKLSDGDRDIKRLADEITPDGFHVAFRTALKLDAEATEEINAANAPQTPTHGDLPKCITDALDPERNKKDAREYMARLVCYVWCTVATHKSKQKASDYVFVDAKDGDRLFSDCSRARRLLKSYGYNATTIQVEAARHHSTLVSWRKKSKMDWPKNWRDMARESKISEGKRDKDAKRKKGRN